MNTDSIAKVGTQHITLSERVYRELRSAIIYQHIRPGQQLRSEELSRRLGVSRTPVKEALSRLRVEGLVEYTERHGFTVVDVTPDDLPEIFEAQTMVELNAVETGLAAATEQDLYALREAAQELERSAGKENPDFQVAYDADVRFHRLLVALGHNQCAMDWVSELEAAVQGTRLGFIAGRSQFDYASREAEHEAIVDALEARDLPRALEAVRVHGEGKLGRIMAYLSQNRVGRPN